MGEVAITYINLAELIYRSTLNEDMYDFDGVEEYIMLAKDALDFDGATRDAAYASACRKCALAFGFYGYFALKEEFAARAEEIYRKNGKPQK